MALCNNLVYFYYNDTQILLRWKCGQGHIDHFELQPYYCKPVSDTSGKLTPRVYDNIQNVPITSLSDGYYQLLYTCPGTDVAEYINYRVRAISTTYTQTYTENNREKTREVSYWTDTWADAYWMATAQESVAGHEWQRKPESVPSISGTKNGNSSMELHITDASTKTQYLYIERSNNGGSWYVLKTLFRNINRITNNTPWNITYTDTSVAAGSSFRYRARTRNWNYSSTDRGYGPGNGFGLFGDYSDVIGPYEFKPSSPGNLAAKVIGTGQVKLTWTNTYYTGTSYRIEYSSYDGDPWKINATAEIQSTTIQGTTSVFTVTGLTPAKWKFRVIRVNSEGEAVAVTSSGKTYVEATVPEAPVVGLNAISQLVIDRHDTILTLRWYTVQESGATYEVQHSLLRDAWALNVAGSIDSVTTDGVAPSLATNWHAYSYEGLEAGRTHYFRVKKVLDDRYSWSGVAQYTLPLDDTSLDEPTNLVAEEVNGNALLTWSADALATGESFLVQYTSLENAFDDNVLSAITDLSIASDVVPRNRVTITDLERGAAWYFRIRRLGDNVASAWTQAIQLDLSPDTSTMEQLSPPTTMSTAMSYADDATVIFSWTHNSSDGAVQSAYEVLVEAEAANGVSQVALLTDDTADSAVSLDLSLYSWPNGTIVYWRVRTQGLYEGYWSDWSRVQQFYVYVQPTASLTVGDTVISMPVEISVETQSQPSVAAPSNDPIECVVSIAPMDGYEGQEADGSIKWHMPGVPMWTKTLGTEDGFEEGVWSVLVNADEVLLTSEITYGATATILTERGMRASVGPVTFTPSWDDVVPMPTASLLFDPDWQYVTIQPRCETSDGTAAQNENPVLAVGVTLSVYRVDPDGGVALIASGLENDGVVTAVDYHANLASCTYRIVARMASTGAQAVAEYSVETPCYGIIVQWDEEWQDGMLSGSTYEDGVPGYTYTGSRLVIDHNASWQEGHEKQLEHKLYQGEQDPIARYGMGRGETISVNGSVLRTIEAEALAALRTLAAYRGDVYVRVPHGMGFPASARVSVNGTAKSEVISYSIDFTRVKEG